jgi:acyl-CoA dehydrogenase
VTSEIAAAARDLLGSAEVYDADGTWRENAERAVCDELAAGGWLAAGLPEQLGGSGGDLADAAALAGTCAAAGHRLPAADAAIVTAHVLAAAGLAMPGGLVLPVPVPGDLEGGRVRVRAKRVPYARWAGCLLVVARDDRACLVGAADAKITAGQNLAGEPRDAVAIDGAPPLSVSAAVPGLGDQLQRAGALARAVQIAAAVQAMLDLTVTYCGQREQFGRPLSRFQAVQQQLALLAAEALAADAAVRRALRLVTGTGWAAKPVAVAKVRTGLAATAGAAIAHQLHGAIGVTTEHPLHRHTTSVWSWREEYGTERVWSRRLASGSRTDLWASLTSADL